MDQHRDYFEEQEGHDYPDEAAAGHWGQADDYSASSGFGFDQEQDQRTENKTPAFELNPNAPEFHWQKYQEFEGSANNYGYDEEMSGQPSLVYWNESSQPQQQLEDEEQVISPIEDLENPFTLELGSTHNHQGEQLAAVEFGGSDIRPSASEQLEYNEEQQQVPDETLPVADNSLATLEFEAQEENLIDQGQHIPEQVNGDEGNEEAPQPNEIEEEPVDHTQDVLHPQISSNPFRGEILEPPAVRQNESALESPLSPGKADFDHEQFVQDRDVLQTGETLTDRLHEAEFHGLSDQNNRDEDVSAVAETQQPDLAVAGVLERSEILETFAPKDQVPEEPQDFGTGELQESMMVSSEAFSAEAAPGTVDQQPVDLLEHSGPVQNVPVESSEAASEAEVKEEPFVVKEEASSTEVPPGTVDQQLVDLLGHSGPAENVPVESSASASEVEVTEEPSDVNEEVSGVEVTPGTVDQHLDDHLEHSGPAENVPVESPDADFTLTEAKSLEEPFVAHEDASGMKAAPGTVLEKQESEPSIVPEHSVPSEEVPVDSPTVPAELETTPEPLNQAVALQSDNEESANEPTETAILNEDNQVHETEFEATTAAILENQTLAELNGNIIGTPEFVAQEGDWTSYRGSVVLNTDGSVLENTQNAAEESFTPAAASCATQSCEVNQLVSPLLRLNLEETQNVPANDNNAEALAELQEMEASSLVPETKVETFEASPVISDVLDETPVTYEPPVEAQNSSEAEGAPVPSSAESGLVSDAVETSLDTQNLSGTEVAVEKPDEQAAAALAEHQEAETPVREPVIEAEVSVPVTEASSLIPETNGEAFEASPVISDVLEETPLTSEALAETQTPLEAEDKAIPSSGESGLVPHTIETLQDNQNLPEAEAAALNPEEKAAALPEQSLTQHDLPVEASPESSNVGNVIAAVAGTVVAAAAIPAAAAKVSEITKATKMPIAKKPAGSSVSPVKGKPLPAAKEAVKKPEPKPARPTRLSPLRKAAPAAPKPAPRAPISASGAPKPSPAAAKSSSGPSSSAPAAAKSSSASAAATAAKKTAPVTRTPAPPLVKKVAAPASSSATGASRTSPTKPAAAAPTPAGQTRTSVLRTAASATAKPVANGVVKKTTTITTTTTTTTQRLQSRSASATAGPKPEAAAKPATQKPATSATAKSTRTSPTKAPVPRAAASASATTKSSSATPAAATRKPAPSPLKSPAKK